MSFSLVPIGELVQPITSLVPAASGVDDTFTYLDLSSVDQARKEIQKPAPLPIVQAPSRARQLVKAGDVLVATVRPNLNGVAVVPPDLDGATASTGFCVLRTNADLDNGYLFHWVRSLAFVTDMVRKATGASYPAVSDRIVKASSIPLPSLGEQRRVAEVLDRADALRAKRRQALALHDDLAQSLFVEMFGDAHGAGGFDVRPLDEWLLPGRPMTYGILMPGPDTPGGVPYVRVVDMRAGGIALAGIRCTTQEISQQYRRSLLRSGDLLVSIRGHVGRLALIPEELDGANITQDSARLTVPPESRHYVLAALRSAASQRWMAKRIKGVAVQGINLGDLRKLPLPDPPLELQIAFAERWGAQARARGAQTAAIGIVDALFASLQQRAFAGEL